MKIESPKDFENTLRKIQNSVKKQMNENQQKNTLKMNMT